MKNKLRVRVICLIILIFQVGSVFVGAEEAQYTVDDAQSVIDGIVAYKKNKYGAETTEEWIEGKLSETAGVSAEWYALALSQSGDHDLASYERALLKYLNENNVYSYSSRQKYALCLSAVGSTDAYISSVVNDSIGKQGIMSLVYGLHLLNNGYVSREYTAEQVVERLLSLQCADGGWSLMGDVGDVDVTAMTCQALAVYYKGSESVKNAVDKAVELLAGRMSENADFSSYGVYNAESTAQVLLTLCSLGIDCKKDARFIRNGKTLFDGIGRYELAEGGYCHEIGGAANDNATSQVLYTMVAYVRMCDGRSPLYILDRADPENVKPATSEMTTDKADSLPDTYTDVATREKNSGYKLWACIAIVGVGVIIFAVLLLAKRKGIKNYIILGVAVAVCVTAVLLTDIRTPDEYYGGVFESKENPIGKVNLSIRCDTVASRLDADNIGRDGAILDPCEITIEEGDTVYDVLVEAARAYRIQLENNGSADMAYIVGINNLYELEHGDLSGWVYLVNGESYSVSCGQYKLSDGDVVEWHYTCQLGDDIK